MTPAASSPAWPKIAVVGAGAVGGYFGGMLARAGAPVILIGRAAFVDAVKKNGLTLDTLHFNENVRVEAATELEAARTEIDSLNGYIARRGTDLGVLTPVNHALYTLVKLAEKRS
jgi:ketopantoate reductase